MAVQKKKNGGDGEPPEELAEPRKVAVQGSSGFEPPVRVEQVGPIQVEPVGPVQVALQRSSAGATADQGLWVAIRARTRTIGFDSYQSFIDRVLRFGGGTPAENRLLKNLRPSLERLSLGVDAYQLLRAATEAFLILRCGVLGDAADQEVYNSYHLEEEARLGQGSLPARTVGQRLSEYLSKNNLPYIDRILAGLTVADADPNPPDRDREDIPDTVFHGTLIEGRRYDPCLLELIWSYWHEEGMLVQAMNAIALRFQNKRVPGDGNPLANLELHPLRPMSNLLWGYIQDEPFRLTVARRAYEYSHQYGISLLGKAVPGFQPADHRSKFLEAFHSLLQQVAAFYKEDADTTVIANGFPLLNSLKEVHMLLAEGAHNQFGDLPWTARVEMLLQQWLLSRAELQDFLRGRPMVPYKEPWMGQVDTLRRMFGWGDTPVTHFRDLGTFGEQILLSIRYGDWINVDLEDAAKNWARYWKPEIQGYIHAYRATTGVDLTTTDTEVIRQINAVPPAVLLQRRLARQGAR
jgi:hypothetical protein